MSEDITGVERLFIEQQSPELIRGRRRRRQRKRIWHASLPLITFALIILIWGLFVELRNVPSYVMPAPLDVFPRIWESRSRLTRESWVTLQEILGGFGISIVTAIPLGLLLALSETAKRALYPAIVFVQLIPKIAVAPLFLVWFGFGLESKIFLVVLLTYFPLLIASITGFSILDQRQLYLTRSMGASTWQTFRYLRLPSAMPVIFSGLKTSATIAATGAIVAEFVGANQGLGYYLLQGTSLLDTEIIFAIIFVLTIIGVGLNYLVELVEYLVTPWQRRSRQER
jgi:NitT/TauT family transport system permease protein